VVSCGGGRGGAGGESGCGGEGEEWADHGTLLWWGMWGSLAWGRGFAEADCFVDHAPKAQSRLSYGGL
jgi:hypothetical protein